MHYCHGRRWKMRCPSSPKAEICPVKRTAFDYSSNQTRANQWLSPLKELGAKFCTVGDQVQIETFAAAMNRCAPPKMSLCE